MEKITRKTLLYKSGVEYTDFCLNHVQGCSHGCRFPCYAFNLAKMWGKVKNYEEWCKPKLVENALELLDKEIPKYKDKIKFVHLCFSTDPFMHQQPEVIEMSLKIINKLNDKGIKCTTLTKGIYPEELIDRMRYSEENEYGITLVSLDSDFKQKFEPFSAPYSERIKGLRRLHENELKTWVSIEPYPTPNIVNQSLENILSAVDFVDKIIFGKLNYNKLVSQFKTHEEFYKKCSEAVESFCKIRRIKFYYNKEESKKDKAKGKEFES